VAVVIVLVIGAVVAAIVAEKRGRPVALPGAREAGAAAHLRSGEFPATCSWCRSTALARRMTVFTRAGGGWRALDVEAAASTLPDDEVAALYRRLFKAEVQDLRRVCSEACTRELLGSAGMSAETIEAELDRCAYCGGRFARTLWRCPHCAAPTG
jgi:hypothetical protein